MVGQSGAATRTDAPTDAYICHCLKHAQCIFSGSVERCSKWVAPIIVQFSLVGII